MCLSPEDMTTEQLENRIETMKEWISHEEPGSYYHGMYTGRLEMYEALVKERYNSGVKIDGS